MFTPSIDAGLVVGTILQLLLVVIGHFVPAVAALFAPLGMLISLIAGLVYGLRAGRRALGEQLLAGALVGGGCALIGIAVSWTLGDVEAVILLIGTTSSAVTGAVGGAIGRVITR
jgi:hypothetical protein